MSKQASHHLGNYHRHIGLKWLPVALVLGVTLAGAMHGCGNANSGSRAANTGGGNGSPTPTPPPNLSPTPTPAPTVSPQSGQFLFAANGSAIWVGRADSGTGQVTSLPTGQTDGATISFLASDPQGRFLYAAQRADTGSSGTTGIGVFSIDAATGSLRRNATSLLPSPPSQLAFDASGKSMYVVDNGAVRAFSVSDSGLTQLPGSPFAAATVGSLSAITPSGRFLINVGNGQAAVFAMDSAAGTPVEIAGSPFSTGATGEQSFVVSPNGKFLFILTAGSKNGGVIEMTINSDGSLAPVVECHRTGPRTVGCTPPPTLGPVSPRQGGSAVPTMVVDAASQYLYVLAADSSGFTRVVSLAISTAGGLTTIPGSPFAQEVAPNGIALDSGGRFLYLGSGNGLQGTVFTYRIEGPTGVLTQVSSTTGFTAISNLVTAP